MREIAELQKQLAGMTLEDVAGEPWVEVRCNYLEAGAEATRTTRFTRADGSWKGIRGSIPAFDTWAELREAMSEPGKGTWFSAQLTIESNGGFSYAFNYDRRPTVGGGQDFLEAPSDGILMPGDDSWLDDLKRYPRSPEFMPEWLAALVAKKSAPKPASYGRSIAAAIAAPVSWPDGYAVLAPKWGWKDMFESVSDHIVARLESGYDYVEVLADESKRDDWPAYLEGLAQDVYGDVYQELLEPRPLDVLIKLWQFYSANLRVPNRPEIDDLDRTALIGRITHELPGVATSLMDDVGDVLTAIIDKQIVDRFGVAAD